MLGRLESRNDPDRAGKRCGREVSGVGRCRTRAHAPRSEPGEVPRRARIRWLRLRTVDTGGAESVWIRQARPGWRRIDDLRRPAERRRRWKRREHRANRLACVEPVAGRSFTRGSNGYRGIRFSLRSRSLQKVADSEHFLVRSAEGCILSQASSNLKGHGIGKPKEIQFPRIRPDIFFSVNFFRTFLENAAWRQTFLCFALHFRPQLAATICSTECVRTAHSARPGDRSHVEIGESVYFRLAAVARFFRTE